MPLEPYWLNQKHSIVEKNAAYLEMETSSGRCLFLLFGVFVFLFQQDWLMYSGILVCVVAWTYSKRWVINLGKNHIRSYGKIVGISYCEVSQDISQVDELFVERRSDSQGISHTYMLRIRFVGGSTATIADRNDLDSLNAIAREILRLMPSVPMKGPKVHDEFG